MIRNEYDFAKSIPMLMFRKCHKQLLFYILPVKYWGWNAFKYILSFYVKFILMYSIGCIKRIYKTENDTVLVRYCVYSSYTSITLISINTKPF